MGGKFVILLSLFSVFCPLSITKYMALQGLQGFDTYVYDSCYFYCGGMYLAERPNRTFEPKETGTMKLGLDYLESSSTRGGRRNGHPIKGRAVINFSKGIITIVEGRNKKPLTLYFSYHGKEYRRWAAPNIAELYSLYLPDTDEKYYSPAHVSLMRLQHNGECYMHMPDTLATSYHISSIKRKEQ